LFCSQPRRLSSALFFFGLSCGLSAPLLFFGLSRRLGPLPLFLALPRCLGPLPFFLALPRWLSILSPSRQDRLHTANQSLDVLVEIAPGIDLQTVAVDELLKAVGKLFDVGHRSAFHQDRNDRHPVAEGRLDFDADRIRWIVDSAAAPLQRSKPTFADDDESDVRLSEYAVDVFAKIDAQRDVIDISKY
jgi:hypothetical protein